jgi:hypothetical protein
VRHGVLNQATHFVEISGKHRLFGSGSGTAGYMVFQSMLPAVSLKEVATIAVMYEYRRVLPAST